MNPPARLVRAVLRWPVETQQGSRRNAMVASTALAQRRRELDEVEAFLAGRTLDLSGSSDAREAQQDVI